MKKATAKDLRQRTAALLEDVRKGERVLVTYRGKSVAVLAPVHVTERQGFSRIGFGMWRDRKDMGSVSRWLKDVRAPRYKA